MTTRTVSLIALSAPFALATGATAEQTSDAWDLLAAIEVDEVITGTSYEVRKVFPTAVENGIEQFDITGYLVPLAEGAEITDFILISDIGFCPFCGSPEHGTSLQVSMADPIGYEDGTRVTLRGALEAVTDPETFQTTIMRDASLIDG
ncbi:hypothetical protein Q4555_11850 [Octadecabacter sp. 1_MG-2023]|uniref:hypothetical protein n=1 Tax=unclassified Octadecabacter TaxID=196158 RepID=UPI001C08036A|nr:MULTISPECIES: hypothetical protein [unclassified Octadecabacter]MBU2993792.1 hypothetical protein [Octadecabacter sp. B2R22]MDO6735363.1 hypothetical protein [Octadecabacter sp. 1_MG-2023]